jgi:S-adenosylmethionine:tRNA-ribosyltransferase-isomerase (queuine synthetase)
VTDIDLNEYDYELPDEKIAQYPLKERDNSKLLIYDGKPFLQEFSGIWTNISLRARCLYSTIPGL